MAAAASVKKSIEELDSSVTKGIETKEFVDGDKSTKISSVLRCIPEEELGQLKQEAERSGRASCVDRQKKEWDHGVAFACSTKEPL